MIRSAFTFPAAMLVSALLIPCLDVSHTSAQTSDVIRLATGNGGGGSIRGTVQRMNKMNVTIDASGSERRVDVNEIRFITFGTEPRELKDARTNMIEGRDNRALEDLRSINRGSLTVDFVRLEVDFLTAMAMANMALRGEDITLGEALLQLKQLLDSAGFDDNYNYYGAVSTLGEVALAAGQYPLAEEKFTEIAALPWPQYALRAKRMMGQAQLGQQKYDEALNQFTAVENDSLNDAEAQGEKLLANIGRASALAGLDRADEGIALLEGIIQRESSEDKALFGKLYNALGACYLIAGNPKYAKHQFLHTDLLFYRDPDTHAEALYHLVQLWTQENNVRSANDARDRLRSSYPNSPWTRKL